MILIIFVGAVRPDDAKGYEKPKYDAEPAA